MRYPCLFVALVPVLAACPVDTGGLGTATDPTADPTTMGSDTVAATDPATTAPGETEAGTATGSGTGTSTGTADGTTTAATTAPSESSSSAGEETGDPPPTGEPYGPCGPRETCMGDDVACYVFDGGGGNMCLPPCDGGNPSCPPPPPDNESLVECVQVQGIHCMLNCAAQGDASCPAGTSCIEVVGGIYRCLWP